MNMRRDTNTDIGKTEMEETGLIDVVKCLMNLRKEVKAIKHSIVSEVKPAYTNQEVMDIFQIASATLKKWRDTGIIGYTLVGNVYLYSKEDINKFLSDHHFSAFSSKSGLIKSVKNL